MRRTGPLRAEIERGSEKWRKRMWAKPSLHVRSVTTVAGWRYRFLMGTVIGVRGQESHPATREGCVPREVMVEQLHHRTGSNTLLRGYLSRSG